MTIEYSMPSRDNVTAAYAYCHAWSPPKEGTVNVATLISSRGGEANTR